MAVTVPPVRFQAAADTKPPSGRATGQVTYDGTAQRGRFSYQSQVDTGEYVPELVDHFQSIREFERIIRKSHIASLDTATRLPLGEFRYYVHPGKASPRMATLAAANLNLPNGIDGPDPDDLPGCLDWADHLPLLLDAPLLFGHAYFSITSAKRAGGEFDGYYWLGELRGDGTWGPGVMPLPQNTLNSYRVNGDGTLDEIEQQGFEDPRPLPIKAARLAAYVYRARPGDWWGSPILRDVYEAEEYRRVSVSIGMDGLEFGAIGTAVARWVGEGLEPPAGRASAEAAVASYRGGGGLVLPAGYVMEILVPGASGANALDWVKHMEQKESAAYMSGVTELAGAANGSRALGETLDDHKSQFIRSLATFACRQGSKQLLRRIVDWNEGPDAAAPSIRFDDGSTAGEAPAALPKSSAEPTSPTTPGGDPAEDSVTVTAAAADGLSRGLTKMEAASRVDFAGIKRRWEADTAKLASRVDAERRVAGAKLAAAAGKAAKANDLAAVAAIDAPSVGLTVLTAAYRDAVDAGSADALAEAKAQGAPNPDVRLDAAYAAAEAQAALTASTIGDELLSAVKSKALTGADAAGIEDHVLSLSATSVADRVGAGLVSSTGEGRLAAIGAVVGELAPVKLEAAASVGSILGAVRALFQRQAATKVEAVRFIGSSVLDKNSCNPCVATDGKEYPTLAAAQVDYPSGAQNGSCEGMGRCRCLVGVVYSNETPAVA